MELKELINYAGFLVGIVGVIISIILFRKGIEAKDPRCHYKTFKNISKLSDDETKIKIIYDQNEVTRVFTTYMWIWNNGKKPINKADFPSNSGIKIKFLDEAFTPNILDYAVIKTSRDEINFTVSRDDETTLVINFDFLDRDDGAVIEVQHTGSADTELTTYGIILGAPDGLKVIKTKKIKNTPLKRAINRVVSAFQVKTYTRSPKLYYSYTVISLTILLSMFAFVFYNMNFNPSITTTLTKLRESLKTEFPLATEQNILNVLQDLKYGDSLFKQIIEPYSNILFFVFFASYFILIISMMIFIGQRDVITPYPKSLALGDNLLKFNKDNDAI